MADVGIVETPQRSQRWLAVLNISGEEIPPFALMRINDTQQLSAGGIVWRVAKPDASAATQQDPTRLMVNGRTPIPIDGYGQGTQDWPAVVRMASGTVGAGCGPEAGSWSAVSGGRAFTMIATDTGYGMPDAMWIAPRAISGTYFNASLATSIAVGAESTLTAWPTEAVGLAGGFTVSGSRIVVPRTGIYHVGFNATVSAAAGTSLSTILGLRIETDSDNWTNGPAAYRRHSEEFDGDLSLGVGAETIAASAVLPLDTDDELWIENVSSVSLSIYAGYLWGHLT